ncbi:MAG: hypothetical protein H7138_17220 [Myxococcales bacterium]|nr:hypothetical protein [Myxococcales bacterium]
MLARRRARRLIDLALAVLVIVVGVAPAHADDKLDPKLEKADRLFDEGRALMESNLLQACDKFDQSLRENPAAIGTLLNVALCDEKLGRFASAVAKFSEARDRAKEQQLTEHQRAAEEHIAALEPSVPHLKLSLREMLPDTKILIDDRVIPIASIADVAVDPGERVLVVSAPARLPYRTKLLVAKAERKTVVVPALARSVTVTSSRRRIGQIVTVAGVLAIGTGAGIGVYADRLFDQQFEKECTHDAVLGDRCSPDGLRRTQRAQSLGNVGTIVGITGAAIGVAGAILWITAPSRRSLEANDRAVTLVPQLGAESLGVVALGRF